MNTMDSFEPKIGFEAEVVFLEKGYPSLVEAAERRNLPWFDDYGETPLFMKKIIANDLSEFIGEKVVVPRETPRSNPSTKWSIGSETSIWANDFFDDVVCVTEIKTPPLPKNESIKALDKMFDFCKHFKAITHIETGLHVNIDAPLQASNHIFPSFIAISLNEEEILRNFNRHGNSSVVPQIELLIVEAASAILDGNRHVYDNIFINCHLGRNKRYAINFDKLKYGYIEFRHCGGPKYLKQKTVIKRTINTYISTIKQSVTATLDKGPIIERLKPCVDEVIKIMQDINISEVEQSELRIYPMWDVNIGKLKVATIMQKNSAQFYTYPNYDLFGDQDTGFSMAWSSGLLVDGLTKAKVLAALTWFHNKKRLADQLA